MFVHQILCSFSSQFCLFCCVQTSNNHKAIFIEESQMFFCDEIVWELLCLVGVNKTKRPGNFLFSFICIWKFILIDLFLLLFSLFYLLTVFTVPFIFEGNLARLVNFFCTNFATHLIIMKEEIKLLLNFCKEIIISYPKAKDCIYLHVQIIIPISNLFQAQLKGKVKISFRFFTFIKEQQSNRKDLLQVFSPQY